MDPIEEQIKKWLGFENLSDEDSEDIFQNIIADQEFRVKAAIRSDEELDTFLKTSVRDATDKHFGGDEASSWKRVEHLGK